MLPDDGSVQTLSAVPDARVIAFAMAAALVTAILFGLAPALSSTRPALTSTLKDEAGSVVGGTGHARFRKGLVVAQVGLSVLLLAGAGLFARSLYNLKTLNPGFETDQLLGFSIDPSLNGYSRERSIQLFQQLQEQLAQIARRARRDRLGHSAAHQQRLEQHDQGRRLQDEGGRGHEPARQRGRARFLRHPRSAAAQPGATSTRRTWQERRASRSSTRRWRPTSSGPTNPIGRHIGWGRDKTPDIEIVGVARNAKMSSLRQEPRRVVYTPYMQEPEIGQMTFYVRARGDASSDRRHGAAGRAARRSQPADLRHEDDERGGGRVAVPRAHGGGAVGGLRRRWRRCSPRSGSTA